MTRTQFSPRSQAGFALVEVLVSAVLVVIMAAGTLVAIQSTQKTSAEERHRATAHGLAQEDQSRMRALRISSLANLNETRQVVADDGTYTVKSRADFVTDSTGTASCAQNTAAADYIRISSTVTWPSIGSRPPVLIQSIVAPPNGAIAANRGALAIAVKGGAGQAMPNISLSGTGAGSFSGTTSENGCVIFGNLPAGNYTLTTNAPGFVNKDGQPPGTVNTSVVALSTNTLALQYDEPGGVDLSFTTLKNGQLVQSSAESVVAFNTGMSAAQVFSEAGPSQVLRADPLFPFSSPDAVYAGGCQANNPNPDDVVGAPGEDALASVQVMAGQVAAAEIQLPSLKLLVLSGTGTGSPGTPVSGASVVLTDTACAAEGQTVKINRTTDATGGLADPGLPWSTYNICVAKSGKASTTPNVSVMDLTSEISRTVYLGAAGTGTCS
jgi:Tfp pilus assembly protein PilV